MLRSAVLVVGNVINPVPLQVHQKRSRIFKGSFDFSKHFCLKILFENEFRHGLVSADDYERSDDEQNGDDGEILGEQAVDFGLRSKDVHYGDDDDSGSQRCGQLPCCQGYKTYH